MGGRWLLLCLALTVGGCAAPAPDEPTPSGPPSAGVGWLHTDATRILDEAGNQIVLHGVDDAVDSRAFPTSVPDDTEFGRLREWGFNTLRLGVGWDQLQPTAPSATSPGWDDGYLAKLDAVVATARAHGIRLLLDMHQAGWARVFGGNGFPDWLYPGATPCKPDSGDCPGADAAHCEFLANTAEAGVPLRPQDGLIEAWRMLVRRYADDPTVVGVDLFNEPQPCGGNPGDFRPPGTSTPLDDFYETAAAAIRAVNPHLLLVYEDNAYASYVRRGFALTRPLDLPNAVYSTHFYADSWTHGNKPGSCRPETTLTGEQVPTDHLSRANAWGQPLYIGEFDGFHMTLPKCPFATDEGRRLGRPALDDGLHEGERDPLDAVGVREVQHDAEPGRHPQAAASRRPADRLRLSPCRRSAGR